MTTFFLDLWHDLREKRLWPVAAGLLAALVAIPAVMLKPASQGTAQPVPVTPTAKVPTLPAVEVSNSPNQNSNLRTFKQRDPFKPLSALKSASSNPTAGSTSSSAKAKSAGGSSPASTSSAGGSAPSSSPTPSSSSTTPSSSGTSPSAGTNVKYYRYTADLSFGKAGALKTLKGQTDFTMLPDAKTAAVVFMGVTNDAKSALFFISDPAYTASGEGTCNDKQDCRFVKLSLSAKNDQETFTSLDGSTVYKLKLLKLNREFLTNSQAQGNTTDSSGSAKLGKQLGGRVISDASATALPRLLDLPTVASQSSAQPLK
jgi:hypothetical protein